MRRCGQININERDPLDMDVNRWIDYWASLKVDALLLNGGGIVAYYPTEVPYHHRSEFLGSRDLFGELVARRRVREASASWRGWTATTRYEPAVKAHPEWFEREEDGSLRPHGESTWLFKTCMFSPYFSEQMPAIYREINRRYQVDGFFTNGWPGAGALTVCYCDACRERVQDEGRRRPSRGYRRDESPLPQVLRRLHGPRRSRSGNSGTRWRRKARRDSVYVGNLGGGIRTVKDMWRIGQTAGWFNADHQGRSGNTPIWDCSLQGRVAAAMMKGRTATNVTGAYANTQPLWRHTSKSPAEATLWMAQTTASGMVPWYHWLGASPEDTRWRETGHAFFRWLADNEPHFRNRRSIADVAVLYPQRTIAFYRSGSGPDAWSGADRVRATEYLQGLYYALLEARVLIDFVAEEDLSEETLRKYRVLILPNAAYLSDLQVQQIRKYTDGAGRSWQRSRPRATTNGENVATISRWPICSGPTRQASVLAPHDNSYMRIEQPHPVLDGFDGTALLPGADERVPIRAADGGPLVLSVVPPYPAFPPEMVFPREPRHAASRPRCFASTATRALPTSPAISIARSGARRIPICRA